MLILEQFKRLNSQLNKLKSAIENETELVIINCGW